MASDIDMASNALILIGDDPISSLAEDVAAANLYASTYEYVLSEHPWSFAMKEQTLSRLSQAPDRETGFSYAYQMPVDLIRLWAVMPVSNYRIVGELLYANASSLLARYVYRVPESRLPAHAVKTIEYKLAADFSISVSEDEKKAQIFERKYIDSLSQSMAKDSSQHPYEGIKRNPIRNRRSRR